MGSIWAASFAGAGGLARSVAIKLLLPELAEDEQYARALRDEAQLAASVRHPNLCEVIELAEANGYPFLVMEWVDGASLAELLGPSGEQRALPPPLAAAIVADACAGLHALHEAKDVLGAALGAVHRDVSPHNILLSRRGHVKVADLGVAKARGQWRERTRSGELRGKLGYLAPEQLRGEAVDRRADVYALGCVLYLALTGRLPYAADIRAFEQVLSGDYVAPETWMPELPAALLGVLRRALQLDPAQRFETAHAMRRALERFDGALLLDARAAAVADCLTERLGPLIAERNRRAAPSVRVLR
jgi:serine/threonine-protein kinase